MMANRLNCLDLELQTCYKYDLDWSLLPEKLHDVCTENICFLTLASCLVEAISFVVSALNNTCDSGHYVTTSVCHACSDNKVLVGKWFVFLVTQVDQLNCCW